MSSLAEESIQSHLEEYVAVMTALEQRFPAASRDSLQELVALVAVASGDLPQRTAEFLLVLATVCPSLTLTEEM